MGVRYEGRADNPALLGMDIEYRTKQGQNKKILSDKARTKRQNNTEHVPWP